MARQAGSITGAKARADRLFSLIIRSRGSCERCGKTSDLQCAHIFSRRFTATRTDETNALALCAGCHHYFTDRPTEFGRWVLGRMSPIEYDALSARAHLITKRFDWRAETARLAARWAEIQAAG